MRTSMTLAVVGAATLTPTGEAFAQTQCDSLENVIYIQSGDTQLPLLKTIGRQLRDDAAHPMTIVFVTAGTCTLAQNVYSGINLTGNLKYIPSTAEDAAWTPADPELTCAAAAGGVEIDVGIGATFIESCNLGPAPAPLGLIPGPIQAYLFAVPEASNETVITAEEGYFVFGFGNGGDIDPWDNEMQTFIRTTTKSTLLTTMASVGVPVAKAKGIQYNGSPEVVAALQNTADAPHAIGILGVEIYDQYRDTLDALAFRAFDQTYAYYPDKTSTSHDRQNVRDGHYTIWAPTVYITPVDGAGDPVDSEVGYFVDLVLGKAPTPQPSFDAVATTIGVGLIPDCAMKVTRQFEGGDLSLYDPAEPCHCYFEELVDALPATCVACEDDTPCGGGTCRHGYCEAH
jgi:hypothetical protein